MNRFVKSLASIILTIVATLTVTACSSRFVATGEEAPPSPGSSYQPANGSVQSDTGGNVAIDVEWVRTGDGSLVFNVVMNTHSVDLDQYDLGALTKLRDNTGNEYRLVSWDSAPGGHHRSGTLIFASPSTTGLGEAKYLEMVIQDVAGIEERVLRWEL